MFRERFVMRRPCSAPAAMDRVMEIAFAEWGEAGTVDLQALAAGVSEGFPSRCLVAGISGPKGFLGVRKVHHV